MIIRVDAEHIATLRSFLLGLTTAVCRCMPSNTRSPRRDRAANAESSPAVHVSRGMHLEATSEIVNLVRNYLHVYEDRKKIDSEKHSRRNA